MSQARYYSSSALPTTLTAPLGASGNPQVAGITGLPSSYPFTILIDWGNISQEAISVTGAPTGTGPWTLPCTRGIDGTTAQSHAGPAPGPAAVVVHGVTAQDFTEGQAHIAATSGVHGVTGALASAVSVSNETSRAEIAEALAAQLADSNTFTADQYFKSGRPWFDVDAFGADPTGVADSTFAFNACIAAALSSRFDAAVVMTAASTTIGDTAAVSGDLNQYINSSNFPGGYSKITAVTPLVGYTVATAATATLTQSCLVGYAQALNGPSPKGKVRIGTGVYKITSDIVIRSVNGFVLEGQGPVATRIAPSGLGFTQAALFLDGHANSTFSGFQIEGDGTEGVSGGAGLPDAIRLDWTTAASRSTSACVFRDILIRNTNFVVGISLEGNGTRQLDGCIFDNVIVTGRQTAGAWSASGNYQVGAAFGNGSWGNNYDHIAQGLDAGGCYYGYKINVSSLSLQGAQPGVNFSDFWILPGAQCTIENFQSQSSNKFLTAPSSPSQAACSFRDILFDQGVAGTPDPEFMTITGSNCVNWLFENITTDNRMAKTINLGTGPATYTFINMVMPNPPGTAYVLNGTAAVTVLNHVDNTSGGSLATRHGFFSKNNGMMWASGLDSARPSATANGEGFYLATNTNAVSHSDGSTWTTLPGASAPDIQWITTTGTTTWTKPPGAVTTQVLLVGPGAGAGSGRRGAAGTIRCGGGGGGGGAVSQKQFASADLASTVTVTVQPGTNGGATVTVDNTNGNPGSSGSATSFGSYLTAAPGNPGQGGTATSGSAGNGGSAGTTPGGAGNPAATTGGAGGNAAIGPAGAGGSSGGGISAADIAFNGALGNSSSLSTGTLGGATGSTGGVVDSTAPTSGTQSTIKGALGMAAGSGAASITTAAQAGANAVGIGAGGSGGGASLNGNNSGAGGNGGPGAALIISYFQ